MKSLLVSKLKSILLWLGAVIWRDDSPKCVFYHDVGIKYTTMGTRSELFWSHMDLLRVGDIVCFDDGFRGIWDAREEFTRRNIRPIVFIAIRLVGMKGYLSWTEIRELQDDYGFTFQSHTWSHQTLAGPFSSKAPIEERSDDWFHRELEGSRKELSGRLGREVNELCFPIGYFSNDVLVRSLKAGYSKVYVSYPGAAKYMPGSFVQTRCLCQTISCADFKNVLNGGMNILANHYRRHHFYGE